MELTEFTKFTEFLKEGIDRINKINRIGEKADCRHEVDEGHERTESIFLLEHLSQKSC